MFKYHDGVPSCDICPKRRLCSGTACYYEDRPERIPDKQLLEDKAILDATEGGDTFAKQK